MFHPRLMAFDLDGTLVESKQRMSAVMGELLSALLKKMPVAVLSGASFRQFETQFLPAFPNESGFTRLYLFPTNAAECFVYTDGTWQMQYNRSFSKVERQVILQALAQCIEESRFNDGSIPNIWGEQIEDRGAEITFSALGQQAPIGAKEKWHEEHEDKRKALHASLTRKLPGLSVAMGGMTTIDITRHGINKAYGIRQLAGLSDISVSEMLYVGDALEEGGNDSVVLETGVKTHEVLGPKETAALIEEILAMQ